MHLLPQAEYQHRQWPKILQEQEDLLAKSPCESRVQAQTATVRHSQLESEPLWGSGERAQKRTALSSDVQGHGRAVSDLHRQNQLQRQLVGSLGVKRSRGGRTRAVDFNGAGLYPCKGVSEELPWTEYLSSGALFSQDVPCRQRGASQASELRDLARCSKWRIKCQTKQESIEWKWCEWGESRCWKESSRWGWGPGGRKARHA